MYCKNALGHDREPGIFTSGHRPGAPIEETEIDWSNVVRSVAVFIDRFMRHFSRSLSRRVTAQVARDRLAFSARLRPLRRSSSISRRVFSLRFAPPENLEAF